MLELQASAPTRVDLLGGTLDIWPLAPILREKCGLWDDDILTVNVAIDLGARVTLQARTAASLKWAFTDVDTGVTRAGESLSDSDAADFPLHRAALRFYRPRLESAGMADLSIGTGTRTPRGSGLGGSSSMMVAMLSALDVLLGTPRTQRDTCLRAQNLEAGVLGNLAGNQDHFAAAFGGVQAVRHGPDGTFSEQILCDGAALMARVVLAHSGQTHFSAFNNWLVLQQALSGEPGVLGRAADIARLARLAPAALAKHDWRELARLMRDEWSIRRTLAEGISTPVLDGLHEAAMRAGAIGGKVCGAGGGGVLVMVLDEPDARGKVESALKERGGHLLPAGFAGQGVQVRRV